MKKKIFTKPDLLIVGAGPVGCVIAERAAKIKNWNSIIIDKRNHIAGNCFDKTNKKGIRIHQYGPHYMRFKKKRIFNYVSNFTKWIKGNYIVKSNVKGELYPIPINLDTIEKFFNKKFKSSKEAKNFINTLKIRKKKIKNSEDFILSKLGKDIYENFYKNYTIKQWGIDPKKLSKNIAGRLPIRFNRNPYYTKEKLRFMPKHGFTKMFNKMIDDKRITIKLNCDYFKIRKNLKYKHFMIYTGEPDKYFDYKYGKLDWRSLIFKFKNLKMKNFQKYVQYNYPNDYKFTRTVEIKHVTKQKSNYTVISREYPTNKGDPYYPISNKKNIDLFNKYKKLIIKEKEKNVFFEGRLANYKYFNTDEVIESSLKLYKYLKKKYQKNL